jgi:hypothetical protein
MAKTVAKAKPAAKAKATKGAAEEVNPELLKAGQSALKGVVFAAEISASVSEEGEDLGLMSAGHAPLNIPGYTIQAIFNGRKRIFSEKFATSKAKKVLSFDGEEYLYRDVVVFTDADGKSFSIFLTGSLSNLTRVLPYNAPVKLTYVGTQEIKEGTYAGNEEHIFSLVTDKASMAVVEANQYTKGCTNWLNNPTAPREKDTTPKEMANLNNYHNAIASGKLMVSEAEKQRLGIVSNQGQIAQ